MGKFFNCRGKKKLISLYLINLACINLKKKKGGLKINDKNPIHKLRRTPPRVLSQAVPLCAESLGGCELPQIEV